MLQQGGGWQPQMRPQGGGGKSQPQQYRADDPQQRRHDGERHIAAHQGDQVKPGGSGQGNADQGRDQQCQGIPAQQTAYDGALAGTHGFHHRTEGLLVSRPVAGGQVNGCRAKQYHQHHRQLRPQEKLFHRTPAAQVGIGHGFQFLVRAQCRGQTILQLLTSGIIRRHQQVVSVAAAFTQYACILQIIKMDQGAGVHAVEARLLVRFLDNHLVDQQAALAQGDKLPGLHAQTVQSGAGDPDMAGFRAVAHRIRVSESAVTDADFPIQGEAGGNRTDAGQQKTLVMDQHAGKRHALGLAGAFRVGQPLPLFRFRKTTAFQDQVRPQGNGGSLIESLVHGVAQDQHGGHGKGCHQHGQCLHAECGGTPGFNHQDGPPPATWLDCNGEPGSGRG